MQKYEKRNTNKKQIDRYKYKKDTITNAKNTNIEIQKVYTKIHKYKNYLHFLL